MMLTRRRKPILCVLILLATAGWGWSRLGVAAQGGGAANRPNVIYILLDDTGFSDVAPYGAEINTPTITALAADGLRFNRFENRALCSPTRAALLTGRHSFTVGMAGLATNDLGPDVPHTRGVITPAAATVAQLLKDNGYRTSAVGKWHLVPAAEQPEATPTRVNWPSGKGFQNFYGWLIGWTDQWNPTGVGREMMEGDRLAPAERPANYHVSEAIVSRGIDYLKQGFAANPRQPQFLYLAFGATHYAVQAPKAYIDHYKGVYEKGWDVIREERFKKQKALGIIPSNATMAARDPIMPAWDSLSADQKRLYAQYMAVYAGFMEHTDAQIGRLVTFLKQSGQYDNTVIFYMHDNGPTTEGGENGRFSLQGPTTVPEMLARIDEIGGPTSSPTYPRGWAPVGATPFYRTKSTLHSGGVRSPLIVTWPAGIKERGALRTQYVEMVDITPTVLDLAGVKAPAEVNGVAQLEMAGRSIRPVFTNGKAATRDTQIFMLGSNRAVRQGPWRAVSQHTAGTPFEQDTWLLFNTEIDFSESVDIAVKYPEKLKELQAIWQTDAKRYGALPLVDGRAGGLGRGGRAGGRGGRGAGDAE